MRWLLATRWVAYLLLPFLLSCATYRNGMQSYYATVDSEQYGKAFTQLKKNRLLKKDRNKLLFYMEAGRLMRLQGNYEESNHYFNLADNYIEAANKSLKDIAVANFINPMLQQYRGEDYEQFMLHYYKALNYIALGKKEDAVVEARRITLSNNAQDDKFKKAGRYNQDAFSLNLQGMIYEMAGDMNNAFIAYRNAAELYGSNAGSYYGVTMPTQLKKDLQHAATAMGFTIESSKYIAETTESDTVNAPGGYLILFLEEGKAPIKEEKNFVLTSAGGGTRFDYIGSNGQQFTLPFAYQSFGINDSKISAIRTLRIAMPVFAITTPTPVQKTITLNGSSYQPALAENINNIATNILQERWATELANAAGRQITKMAVQKGGEAIAESIARSHKTEPDSTAGQAEKKAREEKNKQKAAATGQVVGFIFNALNSITEKADTRNWQSLPAFVSYVRVPLMAGENMVQIETDAGPKEIKVNGDGSLQMMGVRL